MIHFLVYRKRIIIFSLKYGRSFSSFELPNYQVVVIGKIIADFNKIEH